MTEEQARETATQLTIAVLTAPNKLFSVQHASPRPVDVAGQVVQLWKATRAALLESEQTPPEK